MSEIIIYGRVRQIVNLIILFLGYLSDAPYYYNISESLVRQVYKLTILFLSYLSDAPYGVDKYLDRINYTNK
jgi:hypothetical protein